MTKLLWAGPVLAQPSWFSQKYFKKKFKTFTKIKNKTKKSRKTFKSISFLKKYFYFYAYGQILKIFQAYFH